MSKILYENEHYQVILPDEPRMVDGVPLNYQMFNKVYQVTEGYAQIYPQAVGYVDQWSAMIGQIEDQQEKDEPRIVTLVPTPH